MTNETAEYAETLLKHYPHRVLAHLQCLTMAELEKIGTASSEEANANYHGMMLKETAKHGSE